MVDLHVETGEKQAAAHRIATGAAGAARGPDGRVVRDGRVVDLDVAARGVDAATLDRRVAGDRAVVDLEVAVDHVDAATLEGVASGDGAVVDLHIAADDVDAAHDRHVTDDHVAAHVVEGHARTVDDFQAAGSRPIEGHTPVEAQRAVRWMVCPARLGEKAIVSPLLARATSWASEPGPLSLSFTTVRVLSSVRPSSSDACGRKTARGDATKSRNGADGLLEDRMGNHVIGALLV